MLTSIQYRIEMTEYMVVCYLTSNPEFQRHFFFNILEIRKLMNKSYKQIDFKGFENNFMKY